MAGLRVARSLRFSSRSMASRMRSRRGSPGSRAASMRSTTPAARGSVILSGYSSLRPTRGVVAVSNNLVKSLFIRRYAIAFSVSTLYGQP